ncbi:MAG: DUF554 domain-containing protein [Firmicutes bacterium]|nr:DUF554 domain-containing protein [Bacillota bacterium]
MGTLLNAAAIVMGSLLGRLMQGRLPDHLSRQGIQLIGLFIFLIGVKMAIGPSQPLVVLFSLIIGSILGGTWRIEDRLEALSRRLEQRFAAGQGIGQGFITGTLLFCVGPLAIMGSLQDGLRQGITLLANKALLDGLSSVALSSSLGVGVALSAAPVLVYQEGITLLAGFLNQLLVPAAVSDMTAVGGVLIVAMGLNMLGMTRFKVADLLPGLFVALALSAAWHRSF